MNNCEIVENVACGQSFQYCRTHKVEPKDCPGNKMSANVAVRKWKRELKVGDMVKVSYCGVHGHLLGKIGVIAEIDPAGTLFFLDGGSNDETYYKVDTLPHNYWSARNLEHV